PEIVAAADGHDSRLVSIAIEQLVAEPEEARRRDAVVLEDDRRLALPEDPVETSRYSAPQTEIDVGCVDRDLAVPIDVRDDAPHLAASLGFARLVLRPVRNDEEPRRPRGADAREDLPGTVGALVDEERDGMADSIVAHET